MTKLIPSQDSVCEWPSTLTDENRDELELKYSFSCGVYAIYRDSLGEDVKIKKSRDGLKLVYVITGDTHG